MENNNQQINEQIQAQQTQLIIEQTQTQQVIAQAQVQQPVNQPVVYVQPTAFAVQQVDVKTSQNKKGLALCIIGMILGINSMIYSLCLILLILLFSGVSTLLPYSDFSSIFSTADLGTSFAATVIEYILTPLVLGIVGIILSAKGRKNVKGSKMAGAGIATSVIGIAIAALVSAFLILSFLAF